MPDTRTAYRSSTRLERTVPTRPQQPSVRYPAPPQRSSGGGSSSSGGSGGGIVGDAYNGSAFYNPQSATSVSGGAAFDSTGKPLINPLTGQAVRAGSGAGASEQFERVYGPPSAAAQAEALRRQQFEGW